MKKILSLTVAASWALVGVASAGPLMWVNDMSGDLGTIDLETKEYTHVAKIQNELGVNLTLNDFAFDQNGVFYGISDTNLWRVDFDKDGKNQVVRAEKIGNHYRDENGKLSATGVKGSLTFAADGTLYAANDHLYTLNTESGASTKLGTKILPEFPLMGDMTFLGDQLYGISTLGKLVKIDSSTGEGEVLTETLPGHIADLKQGLASYDGMLYYTSGLSIFSLDPTTYEAQLYLDYSKVLPYTPVGSVISEAYGSDIYGGTSENPSEVPEPATMALFGLGLVSLATAIRRKN